MRIRLIFAALVLVVTAASAAADSAAIRTSMDATLVDEPERSMRIDAATTSIEVDVMGAVAVGVVHQTFGNDGAAALSMRYAAAMPRGLRSESVEIDVDGESIELTVGEPKPARGGKKPAARASQAKQMTQRFTLAPGAVAEVEAAFGMPVRFADGRFVLELPAVDAGGWPVATTLAVRVHHAEPLMVAESPTHEIMTAYDGTSTRVEPVGGLVEQAFRFEYAVGRTRDEPDLAGFVGPELDDGVREVMLVLSPPAEPRDESVRPKQVLFVVDTSGSMLQDGKLAEAVSAVTLCLERLGEDDELNVARFAAEFELMGEAPVAADAAGQERAAAWLASMRRGGGTKLLGALEATLHQPEGEDLHRMVVLITDGNLQDEQPVLQMLQAEIGEARLFVVGVGKDMRQETLRRLAQLGRGTAAFVGTAAELTDTITKLFGSVSQPLAWNLGVEADGAEVVAVEPARLPDLYAGRPVTLRAKVRGGVPGEIAISAETMDGTIRFATRPATEATVDALKRLR